MAQQYDDTNRGVLFKNNRKEADNHPDYTGNINVGGVDYWLSAWIKTSAKGTKYMSLSVQPKEPMGEETQVPPKEVAKADVFEGEAMPF